MKVQVRFYTWDSRYKVAGAFDSLREARARRRLPYLERVHRCAVWPVPEALDPGGCRRELRPEQHAQARGDGGRAAKRASSAEGAPAACRRPSPWTDVSGGSYRLDRAGVEAAWG